MGLRGFFNSIKYILKNDSIDGLDPVYGGFYCVFNIVSILIDALTIDLKKGPLTLHVAYIIEYRSVHLLTIAWKSTVLDQYQNRTMYVSL